MADNRISLRKDELMGEGGRISLPAGHRTGITVTAGTGFTPGAKDPVAVGAAVAFGGSGAVIGAATTLTSPLKDAVPVYRTGSPSARGYERVMEAFPKGGLDIRGEYMQTLASGNIARIRAAKDRVSALSGHMEELISLLHKEQGSGTYDPAAWKARREELYSRYALTGTWDRYLDMLKDAGLREREPATGTFPSREERTWGIENEIRHMEVALAFYRRFELLEEYEDTATGMYAQVISDKDIRGS